MDRTPDPVRTPTAGRRAPRGAAPIAWWRWPTVVALDAPLVAVAWQFACAAALGVALRPAEVAVLALSVWLAYSADRLLDARRLARAEARRAPRHAFARRRAAPLAVLWIAGLALDLALATTLEPRSVAAGVVLLGGVAAYFAAVHASRGERRTRGGRFAARLRAAWIGALFAGGAALFPLTGQAVAARDALALLPGLALFALLCAVNVRLIAGWESHLDDGRGPPRPVGRRARGAGGGAAALAALAALVWLAVDLATHGANGSAGGPERAAFALALATSGTLLAALARVRRAPPGARRALADAALLTPLPLVLALLTLGAAGGGAGGG